MLVKRGKLDSSRDEHGVRLLSNLLKRSLDSVENGRQDTGAEFHRELGASSQHWISDSDTG